MESDIETYDFLVELLRDYNEVKSAQAEKIASKKSVLWEQLCGEAEVIRSRMKRDNTNVLGRLSEHMFQMFAPRDPLYYQEFEGIMSSVQLRAASADVQNEQLTVSGATPEEKQQSMDRILALFEEKSCRRVMDESDLRFLLTSPKGWTGKIDQGTLEVVCGTTTATSS